MEGRTVSRGAPQRAFTPIVFGAAILLAALSGGTVAGQGRDLLPPMPTQSLEFFRSLTIADLEAELEHYKAHIPKAVQGYNAWKGKWFADGYLRETQAVLDRIQQAMAEHNVAVRPTWHEGEAGAITGTAAAGAEGAALGGGASGGTGGANTTGSTGAGGGGDRGGSNTLANGAPRNNGNTLKSPKPGVSGDEPLNGLPTFAIAATVVLTAAQIAQCSLAGKDVSACAAEAALKAAGAAATGAVVTVLLPASAATALTAVSFVVTTGVAAVEVVEAGVEGVRGAGAALDEAAANAQLRGAQSRNLALLTPEKVAAFVNGYRAQIAAIDQHNAGTRVWFDQVTAASAALSDIVDAVRKELEEIRGDANTMGLASGLCRNPEKNPVAFVVDVEKRVSEMSDAADRIERAAAGATSRVQSCPTAAEARALFDQAVRDKGDLDHLFADANLDLVDAAAFFKVVKAGRAAAADAATRIAALDKKIEEARQAGARLTEAVATYTGERDKAMRAHLRLAASAQALHGAVARPAPGYIEDAFAEIDSLRPAPVDAYDNDELRIYARDADTEVNRVEGLVALARNTPGDVRACDGIADEMPAALRAEIGQLGSEMSRHAMRAQAALDRAKDVPAKAEACAATQQAGGSDGTLSGRCTGTIAADPMEGKPGTPLHLSVQITGPQAGSISRVLVDNPGCSTARCRDTASRGNGLFDIWLGFQASSTAAAVNGVIAQFQVKFQAFAGDVLMCTGQSRVLKVLAR